LSRASSLRLALALLGLLAASGAARAGETPQRHDDPFPVRNQLPLTLPFLAQRPRAAFLLGLGETRWDFSLVYESTHAASDTMVDVYRADDFATYGGLVTEPVLGSAAAISPVGHAYYVDGETLRASVEGRFGVGGRAEVGFELPLLMHTTGFLDGPIDSYHDWFHFPDGGRSAFAQNQYVVGYTDGVRMVFLEDSPGGVRIGDLVLTGRFALLRAGSGRHALAGSLSVKLPTGNPERLDGSGHADYGAGIEASWTLTRTSFHTGYQYTRNGGLSLEPGLNLRDGQGAFVTFSLGVGEGSEVLVQVLGTLGPFAERADGGLGKAAAEVAAGMRHRRRKPVSVEWAILENLTRDLNVPDVGLYVGLTCRAGSIR
jgi:Protein of unknown function (DUF3187)